MGIDINKLIKPDIDEEFEKIKKYIKNLEEENKFLKEQNDEIKKESFYYNEIKKLTKEICDLKKRGLYFLSDKQQKEVDNFISRHNIECRHAYYLYIISPTQIGSGISFRCGICGEELDITDYEHF